MKALGFSLLTLMLATACSKVNPEITALTGDESLEPPGSKIEENSRFRTTLGSTDGIVQSQNYKMKGRVSITGASENGDAVLVSTNGQYKLKGTVRF